jgi:ATP-dependent helicase/nuclease subunit B
MSTTVAIAPQTDITEEVLRHLVQDGNDYSRNLVVFPGKRPAHFVRKTLGIREGSSFIPPHIFSIDTLVSYLYTEQLGLVQRELQPVDAVAVLHEIYLRSPDRFGGTSFDALDAFLPLGLRLFNELEELKMAHLPAHKLKEAISGITLGSLRPLSTIYESFYEEVNRRSYCSRGLRYAVVADFLAEEHLSSFDKIIVAGFFGLTNAEKIIFQKLGRLDSVVFIFQHVRGLEEHIAGLGLGKIKPPAQSSHASTIKFYQAPDSHGQVFGLTELLKKRIDTGNPFNERTVIVLPAETLPPVYHQTLPLLNENEYNISLGYPVTRTPVYGFLESLMNLIGSMHEGKFYAPEYLKFLLHPYTKNILFDGRSDATRILVHAIEEHFARGKTHAFFRLEELESDVALFDQIAARVIGLDTACTPQALREHLIRIHSSTIRRVLGVSKIGALARGCIETLLFIDEHSTAQYHPLFRPYVETIIGTFEDVASSLLANATVRDVEAAFTFLRRCLSQATVPFPGTPLNGLQVLGFLETRNLRFDTVYVLDANEDVLPGSGSEHTIIPEPVRDRLGLPTRRQREQIAAYYFDILVTGAAEVHLFFANNAQKERSPFVEQLLWKRQRAEQKEDAKEYISTISYSMLLANSPPSPIPKSPGMADALQDLSYSATALDTYLACPLKFYYRYVLGLREKEEVAGDIDSSDVGRFVHDVLRAYFFELIGREMTPADMNVGRLQALVDNRFAERFGEEMTGARYVLKQQVHTQLRRFLEQCQAPMLAKGPITLLAVEQKHEVRRGTFLLNGTLDRVERRGERIHVLDYKTGNPDRIRGVSMEKLDLEKRETWKAAIPSLQLPVYAMLYSGSTGVPIEQVLPAYLRLSESTMDQGIELPLFEEMVAPATGYRQIGRVVDSLLSEIVDANVPFAPTDTIEKDCVYCPFQSICGTQWVSRMSRTN